MQCTRKNLKIQHGKRNRQQQSKKRYREKIMTKTKNKKELDSMSARGEKKNIQSQESDQNYTEI